MKTGAKKVFGIALFLASPALADANLESSKLSSGVVTQGTALESPKVSSGIVVQGNVLESPKVSTGIIVGNTTLQSPKLSVGIVVMNLHPSGIIPRAPLTHW
ncbi:MAG TPA: hypothetical protein VHU18_03490 [Rhizomicrobium sp.]|jgi:hypothetical protein|nr:hypothetical protein [Rhizomicrobium sp.]